jgi:hypothetical protein
MGTTPLLPLILHPVLNGLDPGEAYILITAANSPMHQTLTLVVERVQYSM